MLRRFRLEEPESVKEASELLARYGERAKVYAGGTELLLAMKEGLIHYERLVNLKRIPDLAQIVLRDGTVHVGALATHRALCSAAVMQGHLPALAEMERNVANIRVREVGTIGGNLCFAEPHADPGTLLLALGARAVAANGSSKREIPMGEFFLGAYECCLAPDEILTEIRIPLPPGHSSVAYLKFGYLERPSVGVAVLLTLNGAARSVADVRIAIGCVGPTPKRVDEAEALLRRKGLDEASELIAKAGEIAGQASQAISDLHGSKEYKEHVVQVLLKRAFQAAVRELQPKGRGRDEPHV